MSQDLPAYFTNPLLFGLILSIHDKKVFYIWSPRTRSLGIPSRQGEGRFEQRISRFIKLGWGIVTVIILAVFTKDVKLFAAAASLTRLK